MNIYVVTSSISFAVYAVLTVVALILWIRKKSTNMMKKVILARWFHGLCFFSSLFYALFFTFCIVFIETGFRHERIRVYILMLCAIRYLGLMTTQICYLSVYAYWVCFYHSFRQIPLNVPRTVLPSHKTMYESRDEQEGLLNRVRKPSCLGDTFHDKFRNVVLLSVTGLLLIGFPIVLIEMIIRVSVESSFSTTSSDSVPWEGHIMSTTFIIIHTLQLIVSLMFGFYIIRFVLYFRRIFQGQEAQRRSFLRKILFRILAIPIICFILFFSSPFAYHLTDYSTQYFLENQGARAVYDILFCLVFNVLPLSLVMFFFNRLSASKFNPSAVKQRINASDDPRKYMKELNDSSDFSEVVLSEDDNNTSKFQSDLTS